MGWCSGTEIFDRMTQFILKTSMSDEEKYEAIHALAESLEDQDWDCQSDSDYSDEPIVERVFKALHPDWDWDSDWNEAED